MNEGLEKLRSIGAQKIHEQTHIAHRYVQAILHESFDDLGKVQLMGFISILEREYGVTLEELKKNACDYYMIQEKSIVQNEPAYKQELLKSSQRDNTKLYTLVIFALLIGGVLFGYVFFSHNSQEALSQHKKQEHTIEVKEEKHALKSKKEESNISQENNTSSVEEIDKIDKILKIIPKSKVWVGYIDLENDKKVQTTTIDPLELNGTKEYLLSFGHGYIKIETQEGIQKFTVPHPVKFHYKDGVLERLSIQEFKQYNKGKLW